MAETPIDSLGPWVHVWVFTEFDFFPEGDEQYEEEDDDETAKTPMPIISPGPT